MSTNWDTFIDIFLQYEVIDWSIWSQKISSIKLIPSYRRLCSWYKDTFSTISFWRFVFSITTATHLLIENPEMYYTRHMNKYHFTSSRMGLNSEAIKSQKNILREDYIASYNNELEKKWKENETWRFHFHFFHVHMWKANLWLVLRLWISIIHYHDRW